MAKTTTGVKVHTTLSKKTCQSGKPSMVKRSSMNKTQKRSYKKYRGQGR